MGKVKLIVYRLYNQISHNSLQIMDDYSIWALCFCITLNATTYSSLTRLILDKCYFMTKQMFAAMFLVYESFIILLICMSLYVTFCPHF